MIGAAFTNKNRNKKSHSKNFHSIANFLQNKLFTGVKSLKNKNPVEKILLNWLNQYLIFPITF
ncbi:hypothetical protein BOO91_03075 [Vibrio navarrensis]|nr:hypothetical protein [Vibrio navarrensis]